MKGKKTMAIYSLHTTPSSRSNGKNALAMAAYRSGERLLDLQTGEIFDYTRKCGVLEKNIIFPQGVSFDRQELWNMAESAEKRKDSRIAREILIALPHELQPEARLNLVMDYAQEIVNRYQIAVDFSIHAPNEKGDNRNFHAHLMLTTRQITKEGLSDKSELEKNNKFLKEHGLKNSIEQIEDLRQSWENYCNIALQRNGIDEQISAKSYEARNMDIMPTIHIGTAASEMERRGIETEKGTLNRIIRKRNKNLALQRRKIALQRAYEKMTRKAHQLENEIRLEIEEKLKKELIAQEKVNIIQEPVKKPEKEILSNIEQPQEENKNISATDILNKISGQNKIREQEKSLNATELLNQQKNMNEEKEQELNKEREQIKAEDLLKQYTQNKEQLEQQAQEKPLTAHELLYRNKTLNHNSLSHNDKGIER